MNVIALKIHSAIHDVCFLLTRLLANKVTQGSPGFLSSAGRPTGVSIPRDPQMNAASECLHSRWRHPSPHAQALMTGSFRTECLSRDKWPQATTCAANRLQETRHGTIKEKPVLKKEQKCNQVLRPGWAGLCGYGGQALPLQTYLWIELGRAVGAINSQLPPGWRTENHHPNSIHSHKVNTYIGGNDSLLPSGSLWLTGVPTLLGFLELMAGSFTCVKKIKSMS